MCLILVAWKAHPRFPLVVAANRDEFFARPTATAGFWPETPAMLAGRDLQAGGTWMGYTRNGRFAALTNFRDPAQMRTDAESRGALVAGFLSGDETPEAYLARVGPQGPRYNGFNLLVADRDELAWYSNVGGGKKVLAPGIYGVSNHLLDTPWPKLQAAKSALARALDALPDDQALFDLLRDDEIHPDDALPRTGVSVEWERVLSSAFVKAPGYGTRSSTVLLRDDRNGVVFDEQTWLAGGAPGGRARFRFTLPAAP
ncbi:MAG TPA: NRDE family protein [Rhodocyclaceae bacterium]|nr:NRDE family protein [Rhodocyclaceae bacterium]